MKHAARGGTALRNARAPFVGLLLALAATAAAGEPVALRWKLEPGQVVRYTLEQTTTLESKPEGGRGVHTERRQAVDFHWTVASAAADAADLKLAIDRVRVRIVGDGLPSPFEFDTAADGPRRDGPFTARLVDLLKGLAGSEVAFRMSARGEVGEVKLSEPLQTLIRQAGAIGGAAVFSEEGIRNLIIQAVPYLPEAPVETGATWSRQVAAPMPMLGALIIDKTYTDRGPRPDEAGVHDVAVDTRFTVQQAPEAALEVKLLKHSGSGAFAFDARRGLVESGRLDDALTMAFSAQGQRVEQTTTARIELKLVPPAAGPAADAPPPPAPPTPR
ncbi:hypothetical protein [Paludisphaera mucosa]|uniref:Uncharacterized protein n=1 Tax=Paludisphaera mucosa TaxID=3030827 RepID=A0ABT6FHR9_9BACT|nr:hypothetical protein [Paludisphaera mucosa]MDG3007133.1 hypothetical protein [Paludisphaera mucosa]